MNINDLELFPLSINKEAKGSRRLARVKVLQMTYAYFLSGQKSEDTFPYFYNRIFNFGDELSKMPKDIKRLLKPSEVVELEADIPIKWDDEEIEFMDKLIDSIIENEEETNNLLLEAARNWDLNRIAITDKAIMHLAINELILFDDIPIKVTINEAIDLAKDFSTNKSNIFINGVLDTLLEKLKQRNKINKKGKGLKEK